MRQIETKSAADFHPIFSLKKHHHHARIPIYRWPTGGPSIPIFLVQNPVHRLVRRSRAGLGRNGIPWPVGPSVFADARGRHAAAAASADRPSPQRPSLRLDAAEPDD